MPKPKDYLFPILHSIESAIILISKEYPKVKDKEIESSYKTLKLFFRQKSFNESLEEPESTNEVKQDLMDEILNALDVREEGNFDSHLLNDVEYSIGGKMFLNLNQVYAHCFNCLEDSVRFWRKDKNSPSYLAYIKKYIPTDI